MPFTWLNATMRWGFALLRLGPGFDTKTKMPLFKEASIFEPLQRNVHVMSNPVLLDCILRNLLTNAIRYTEPGGPILIGCRRRRREIRIDVYDMASAFRKTNCRESSDPSSALHPNAATVWASGSLSFALEVPGHRIEIGCR